MILDRLQRVCRAGWVVPAHLPVERANQQSIGPEKQDDHVLHRFVTAAVNAESRSQASRRRDAPLAFGNARTTSNDPAGSRSIRSRTRCRSRRRTRLRSTAFPTARLTTKPTRAGSADPRSTKCATNVDRPERRPERTLNSNSAECRIRCVAGNTATNAPAPRLRGEADPPPPPTSVDDRPTSTRAHPRPEAVLLVTTPIVRLVCALHEHLPRRYANLGTVRVGPGPIRIEPGRRFGDTVHPRP